MGLNGKTQDQPQSTPHPRSDSPRTWIIERENIAQELAHEILVERTALARRERNEQRQRELEEYERQNPPRRRRYQ